jgi:hypothetical protein
MIENIPEWITNLALDIYKVIQQYKAMPRFHEMVNKWAENREAEIDKLRTWNEQRRLYFEQTVARDPRLQDDKAGPPERGWQFESHIQHTEKKTEPGSQRSHNIIHGWVPLELSNSIKPEITQLFPLSREHKLTLIEKYTVLAAVYDYARKGTEEVPPWQWPDFNLDQSEEALSDAKKSLFFEGLCDKASKLNPNDEGWLRALLYDIEKDASNCSTGKLSQPKKKKQIVSSETRTDKCIKKIKDHPVLSLIIVIGIIIIALGAVAGGLDNILSFWNKNKIAHSPTESTNIFADVSKDGSILRSKNFPWKITKTKYRNGNILYTIVDRRGDPTAISVLPDNSINEYFVRDSWDGLVIEFTCAEEKISNFTIKVKY